MILMNKKGQALVEFVLILPVFLMILFAVVDFGNLLYRKNQLENVSTDIVRLIRNGTEVTDILKEYSNISVKLAILSINNIVIVKTLAKIRSIINKR